MRMMHRYGTTWVLRTLPVFALAAVVACSGSGDTTEPPGSAVAAIAVTPAKDSLVIGGTQQLTASPTTASGDAASATITWSSADAAIATVSAEGRVTAVAAGTAQIRASAGGVTGSATIIVREGAVVGASGGTVATMDGAVALNIPAGALGSSVPVSVAPAVDTTPAATPQIGLGIPGATYTFGPEGTQFAAPVTLTLKYDPAALPLGVEPADLQLSYLNNGVWEPITEGASVDPVAHTVSAQVHHFSSYGISRKPCTPGAITLTNQVGALLSTLVTGDCALSDGRRTDYVNLGLAPNATTPFPAGRMLAFRGESDFAGTVLLTTPAVDPDTAFVWAGSALKNSNAPVNSPAASGQLYLVTNGDPIGFAVRGASATALGSWKAYVIPALTENYCPAAGQAYIALMPGASFTSPLTGTNTCHQTVASSPYPEAIGKPINTHDYLVRLRAGKTYTVALSGDLAGKQITLTVFRGTTVAGQDIGTSASGSTRSASITPATDGDYDIEVSSGGFNDANAWVTPSVTYTVSVSR